MAHPTASLKRKRPLPGRAGGVYSGLGGASRKRAAKEAFGMSQPAAPRFTDPELAPKFAQAFDRIRGLGRVVVAYSGGVDSALALKIGSMALGEDCVGVIARSETLAPEEFGLAMEIADAHGFQMRVVEYSELEIEGYAENPANRCYFCKRELHTRLGEVARELGARAIVDGVNLDDAGDYRPGIAAARELGVVSPLLEAGMSKSDIRAMARELGLANWDKPAAACLSSRIPYGERIDKVKLRQIAEGEAFLRAEGFAQARLRHHDKIARIEVAPEEIARLARPDLRERVTRFLRGLGFQYVTADLAGYRTGSLNEALDRGEIGGVEKGAKSGV